MRLREQERNSNKNNKKTTYKVLLVDDEPLVVKSLIGNIQRYCDCEVEGLTNPVEALEKIRHNRVDLIVLDYVMPEINGAKFVEKLRQFDSKVYILLLTGHSQLAPPLKMLKQLDIQGYCEKSDRVDQLMLLIQSALKSISLLHKNIKYEEGLDSILGAAPDIYKLQPTDSIMEEILLKILPFANGSNGFIIVDNIFDQLSNQKGVFKGVGKYKQNANTIMPDLAPYIIEQISISREKKALLKGLNYILIPLLNEHNNTIGIIYLESSDYEDGLKLIDIFSKQASAALTNSSLHALVNFKNEQLIETNVILHKTYMDTIEALRLTVDAKDYYTRGHSDRVAFYSLKMGKALNISESELENIRVAGLFHDIGKIGTSDDILFKTQKLNFDEYSEIKKHPIRGAHILSAITMFTNVVPLVRCHHERIDGTGYPLGLVGDKIPIGAKIISVADSFDAMTTDRHYRPKLKLDTAIEQLKKHSGTQFDKEIIDLFIKLLDSFDSWQDTLNNSYVTHEP